MSTPVKVIQPSPCTNKLPATIKIIETKFKAALQDKSGNDIFLGYVGGKSGQVKVILSKDKTTLYADTSGLPLKLDAHNANDAVAEIRADIAVGLLNKGLLPLHITCLKPIAAAAVPAPVKTVAEVKVGTQTTANYGTFIRFMGIPHVKDGIAVVGDPAYFISLYKASDKYALGLGHGKAVVINLKLNANEDEIRKEVYRILNHEVLFDFTNPKIKRYTPDKVRDMNANFIKYKKSQAEAKNANSK